ncbi:MAG: RHS repeat-associated core domain-containing protein [Planctomycetota bacterium]|nr:MAG: RHS repeat-associated core domain-containing protein [Planctomycetota bacterium]
MTDHQGTVRQLAFYDSGSGDTTIQRYWEYDSFGNVTSETAAAVDHLFGYTGRAFDDETGLQNNLHRWYDPVVGRWASEDPIGFAAGDANLYRYVGNGPTNAVDPSGLADPQWNEEEVGEFLTEIDDDLGAFWNRPNNAAGTEGRLGKIESAEKSFWGGQSFSIDEEHTNAGSTRLLTRLKVNAPDDMTSAELASAIANELVKNNDLAGEFEEFLVLSRHEATKAAKQRRERILARLAELGEILEDMCELVPGGAIVIAIDDVGEGRYFAGGFGFLLAAIPADELGTALKVGYKSAKGAKLAVTISKSAYGAIQGLPSPVRRKLFQALRQADKSTDAQKLIDLACAGKKIRKAGVKGKAGATDIPSWVRRGGEIPNIGEAGRDFAKRLMDEKYGAGNWKRGAGTEFSEIQKWADRSFQDPF